MTWYNNNRVHLFPQNSIFIFSYFDMFYVPIQTPETSSLTTAEQSREEGQERDQRQRKVRSISTYPILQTKKKNRDSKRKGVRIK